MSRLRSHYAPAAGRLDEAIAPCRETEPLDIWIGARQFIAPTRSGSATALARRLRQGLSATDPADLASARTLLDLVDGEVGRLEIPGQSTAAGRLRAEIVDLAEIPAGRALP